MGKKSNQEVGAAPAIAGLESDLDLQRDFPFLLVACLLHAFLLIKAPGFNWTADAAVIPEQAVAVEIVQQIPQPSPFIAPMAPGTGKKEEAFHHGPGPIRLEKVKRGHPHAKPAKKKMDPSVLAAMKAKRLERQRKTLERMMAEQERKRELDTQRAEQRRILAEKRAEERKIAAEQRRIAAEKRAEELKIAAEKRAEEQRIAAEQRTEQKRLEEERRLAIAKAKEEERQRILAEKAAAAERRRQFLAEQRRIQSERRADVERQLATLSNPDDAVTDASGGEVPAGGGGPSTGKVVGHSASPDPGLAGGGVGLAAAAAADAGDFAADGRDGHDALNMKASGGGIGHGDGGPVSWYLEGTAGNRKLLKRVVPPCPDWVSSRGLDLAVQLKFRVLENGEIKEILVKKTSGFPELDQLAINTLRRWKFDSYKGKATEKVPSIWGMVSFRFVAA